MQKSIYMMIGLSVVPMIQGSLERNFFKSFDQFFELQEQMIREMRSSFAQEVEGELSGDVHTLTPQYEVSVTNVVPEAKIIITLDGVRLASADDIHTALDYEHHVHTLTLPDARIVISLHDYYGAYAIAVDTVQEKTSKKDAQDDHADHISRAVSQQRTQCSVPKTIQFDEQVVAYNGDDATLTITIPYEVQEEKVKPVAVHFVPRSMDEPTEK